MSADQIQEMRRQVELMQSELDKAMECMLSILGEFAANSDVTGNLFNIIEGIGALKAYANGKIVEFDYVKRHFYTDEETSHDA